MIRNDRGDHFLLIAQHDHALLAGQLAERLGNRWFDGPEPRREAILGIEMHDCGWPLHDDAPTLNPAGLPLHVMETPVDVAVRVWSESAALAGQTDPYAGLLVSLHVFRLSSYHVHADVTPREKLERLGELFLLNQFQQYEIERQETLRPLSGLRTDRPLQFGLAEPGTDPEEDRLRFNSGLLRAMDAISLEACTGKSVFSRVGGVHPRIGAESTELALTHPSADVVRVNPWPFAASKIILNAPARRITKTPFATLEAFRQAYASAERLSHPILIEPG